MTTTSALDPMADLDGASHREIAVALFNHVWPGAWPSAQRPT